MKKSGWLIYAMGGGWGHLNRALSLARIAAHENHVTVITNCKQFDIISQAQKFKELAHNIEFVLAGSTKEHTVLSVSKAFETNSYSTIVVDTFPRGLIGELADILPNVKHARKILVARDISPEYVRKYSLIDFVKTNFDLVINPGEGKYSTFSELAVSTEPWLIRDDFEIPDRNSMREQMKIADSADPVVLICASGTDVALFASIAAKLSNSFPDVTVRMLSPYCPSDYPEGKWINHWPGIECVSASDLVIAGAGFNITNECAALRVPLIALPQKRLYDRQELRAASCFRSVQTVDECIGAVEEFIGAIKESIGVLTERDGTSLLNESNRAPRNRPSFKNGAHQAVNLINRLSDAGTLQSQLIS